MLDINVRMKNNYEAVTDMSLMKRCPVIIRVDGRSFKYFTQGFQTPFDPIFREAMIQTMLSMCKEMQGCVFAYTQSDEISFVLVDYAKLDADAWFDYRLSKLLSISAALATKHFNNHFRELADLDNKYYARRIGEAVFDAHCFNVPKDEVTNYVLSRQLDGTRNAVCMVARHEFKKRNLGKVSTKELVMQLGDKWTDIPTKYRIGVCATRNGRAWVPNYEMPLLLDKDREMVESLVNV